MYGFLIYVSISDDFTDYVCVMEKLCLAGRGNLSHSIPFWIGITVTLIRTSFTIHRPRLRLTLLLPSLQIENDVVLYKINSIF